MALHSSTLAWRIPQTEEPDRLQPMGSQRVGHDWATFTFTFHFHALEKEMATHSSVLAWRIPGTGEPGRLPSMGSHRVGHDWSDLAAAARLKWTPKSLHKRGGKSLTKLTNKNRSCGKNWNQNGFRLLNSNSASQKKKKPKTLSNDFWPRIILPG